MSYKCIIGHKIECDGCGDCKRIYLNGIPIEPQLTCDYCENHIEENAIYYKINNEILCKDCLDDMYGYIK